MRVGGSLNSEKMVFQDSYTEKLNSTSTLKVYLDMNDLKDCEVKLKNFMRIKNFISELQKVRE